MSQGHILVPVERIKKLEAGGGSSAATAVDIAIPLLKDNWNFEENIYKQIVVVNGLEEDSNPIIVLSPVDDKATQEELDAYNCLTNDVVVDDGFITFTAKQLPIISFTVIAKGTTANGDAVATVTNLVNKVSELETEINTLKSDLDNTKMSDRIVRDYTMEASWARQTWSPQSLLLEAVDGYSVEKIEWLRNTNRLGILTSPVPNDVNTSVYFATYGCQGDSNVYTGVLSYRVTYVKI